MPSHCSPGKSSCLRQIASLSQRGPSRCRPSMAGRAVEGVVHLPVCTYTILIPILRYDTYVLPYLAFTALTGKQTKEAIHQQPRNGSGWSLGTAERKYWFNQIRVTEPVLIKDMRRVPGMTISR